MGVYALDSRVPVLGEGSWVADNATVLGNVVLGKNVSIFFFFKQKTAYEIDLGDWSSDVCSSDL